VKGYGTDPAPFELRHEPGHPAADANGYVKHPNVNEFVTGMMLVALLQPVGIA